MGPESDEPPRHLDGLNALPELPDDESFDRFMDDDDAVIRALIAGVAAMGLTGTQSAGGGTPRRGSARRAMGHLRPTDPHSPRTPAFAMALMHRYANLAWYLRRLPSPAPTLDATITTWFGIQSPSP